VVGETLGTAMLVVEQNAHLALQFAGSAYLINRGQIVFSGSADEVAASPAMAESYLGGKRAPLPEAPVTKESS
jgi:branched-chain amino acid transport system ATP-binding protein